MRWSMRFNATIPAKPYHFFLKKKYSFVSLQEWFWQNFELLNK